MKKQITKPSKLIITEFFALPPRKDGVSTYTNRNGKMYYRPDFKTATIIKLALKRLGKTWKDGASEFVGNCLVFALAKEELKNGGSMNQQA